MLPATFSASPSTAPDEMNGAEQAPPLVPRRVARILLGRSPAYQIIACARLRLHARESDIGSAALRSAPGLQVAGPRASQGGSKPQPAALPIFSST